MASQCSLARRLVARVSARRLASLLLCLALLAVTLVALVTGTVPESPGLVPHEADLATADARTKPVLTPFRPLAHRPPRQKDDEYAGSVWWAAGKWLSVPFSSSLTFDSHRALLPPLRPRPPIYCYHDAADVPRDELAAESDLLLTWRRAWWARGFRPLVLTAADAIKHPNHTTLAQLDVGPAIRKHLNRWLAWHAVGGGVLAHYTLLPMAADDDSLLSSLRRDQFPRLTRWKDLGDALLAGGKEDIAAAIQKAMRSAGPSLLVADLPDKIIEVDETPAALASYTRAVVDKKIPRSPSTLSRAASEVCEASTGSSPPICTSRGRIASPEASRSSSPARSTRPPWSRAR